MEKSSLNQLSEKWDFFFFWYIFRDNITDILHTAVEVGAANLVDPFACRRIVEDLPRVMQKYNINDLNDIIGGAHHG